MESTARLALVVEELAVSLLLPKSILLTKTVAATAPVPAAMMKQNKKMAMPPLERVAPSHHQEDRLEHTAKITDEDHFGRNVK